MTGCSTTRWRSISTTGARSLFAASLVIVACGQAPSPAATSTPATAATSTPAPTGFTGEVKVGVVSPFSGSVGFLGEYMANSLQIEIDKVNAQGGLLRKKVLLVKRDDQLNPAISVTATRELIDSEKVSLVVGPSFTGNHAAVKQLINDSKVANCIPTVSGPQALENAPYTWRTQDPDLLREGPYPWNVKQRIASRHGHLSNEQGAGLLEQALGSDTRTILLGHLSEANNMPAIALACARLAVERSGRGDIHVFPAEPHRPSKAVRL